VSKARNRTPEHARNADYIIQLNSAGFKIDPAGAVEFKNPRLPIHQTWSISANSEGKHTLVLSLRIDSNDRLGFAELNNTPVAPEETYKLPITVYTIYGVPLWVANTLGSIVGLGGFVLAWHPIAAWLNLRARGQAHRNRGRARFPLKKQVRK
jgi:hypothetical protein